MCGFIATISKDGLPFPEGKLREMTSMLIHRGPDDEGFYLSDHVSLGFRRLKIIDLSENAHQPMTSIDGRYSIVFNGEIYNYREIRRDLKAKGVIFRSDSDTEVLLNALILWGESCLSRLIGMFAFALYDSHDESIIFSRDQLGIKPLFCYEDSRFIFLTSEIKALLPYASLEPDPESFNEYLVFRSLPGERTMFKGVRSILPGTITKYKNGVTSSSRYFKIEDMAENPRLGFEQSCKVTEEHLRESIELHLRSDVELGIQLSGGVDSSLIAAIASELTGKTLHSFSVSFEDSKYDESEYQKRVSNRYNTEHHDFRLDENSFVSGIEKAIWHYEHPLNDPNSVSTWHLARMAKQYVTVMLSGEGADESFLGYSKFLPHMVANARLRNFLHGHPSLRKGLMAMWPFKKGKALLRISAYPPAMLALSYAQPEMVHDLLDGKYQEMLPRASVSQIAGRDTLKEILLQDEICDLPQWFWRADKMGMASSMEFRVPFCTTKMFALANSIPYKVRIYHGERKAILKKIAEKYIDHDQIYRKKMGFGTPIEDWLKKKGRYFEFFEDVVGSKTFKSMAHINQKHFKGIYDSHRKGSYKETNSAFLWTYFNLGMWHEIFFSNKWRSVCRTS